MTTPTYRASNYICFDKGIVRVDPMSLINKLHKNSTIHDKLKVFECRVDVWQLGPAVETLKMIESSSPPSAWCHAAYAMIAVICSYFEMVGKILNTNSRKSNTSSVDFLYGFCDVNPSFKPADGNYTNAKLPAVAQFRDKMRNGLYHLGCTKHGLIIPTTQPNNIFEFDKSSSSCRVHPHKLVPHIVEHFPSFVSRIKDSDKLKAKFVEFYDDFHAGR